MDYREQLKDSGAVIGYSPDIRLYKKDPVDGSIQQEDGIVLLPSQPDYSSYSTAVQRYVLSPPSSVAQVIQDALDLCNEIMDEMCNEFNSIGFPGYSDIDKFIVSLKENNSYADEFLGALDKAEGSVIPGIIKVLTDQETLLNKIQETYLKLYYGNKYISIKNATEKDNSVLAGIMRNDMAGTGNNSVLLYHDGKLNYCVKIFAEDIQESILGLSDIININHSDVSKSSSMAEILSNAYDNLAHKHNKVYSVYRKQHLSFDTANKALYNYYSARNEMNVLFSAMNESEYGDYIYQMGVNAVSKTDNALTELCRPLLANERFLAKTDEIFSEKQAVSSLYKSAVNA